MKVEGAEETGRVKKPACMDVVREESVDTSTRNLRQIVQGMSSGSVQRTDAE